MSAEFLIRKQLDLVVDVIQSLDSNVKSPQNVALCFEPARDSNSNEQLQLAGDNCR